MTETILEIKNLKKSYAIGVRSANFRKISSTST